MCLSLCVCLFINKLGKLRTLTAQTSYWQTSNYTRNKNNNRVLLKPFGYKVMTIYITHGYGFQTWEDSLGQLDTCKHNCYSIMAIASKAVHEIKHSWGSPGYNMSSTNFKTCAVHVIRTRVSIFLFVERFTGLMRLSFFFENLIKQRLKCKTYRDKIHVFFIYFCI